MSCVTECLAAQLESEGTALRASIFYPSGGLLRTGLWTADRNRPAELAREKPRATKAMTVEDLEAMAKKGGHELKFQDLDELAQVVVQGDPRRDVRDHDRPRVDRRHVARPRRGTSRSARSPPTPDRSADRRGEGDGQPTASAAQTPPSTSTSVPVRNEARSDSRKAHDVGDLLGAADPLDR